MEELLQNINQLTIEEIAAQIIEKPEYINESLEKINSGLKRMQLLVMLSDSLDVESMVDIEKLVSQIKYSEIKDDEEILSLLIDNDANFQITDEEVLEFVQNGRIMGFMVKNVQDQNIKLQINQIANSRIEKYSEELELSTEDTDELISIIKFKDDNKKESIKRFSDKIPYWGITILISDAPEQDKAELIRFCSDKLDKYNLKFLIEKLNEEDKASLISEYWSALESSDALELISSLSEENKISFILNSSDGMPRQWVEDLMSGITDANKAKVILGYPDKFDSTSVKNLINQMSEENRPQLIVSCLDRLKEEDLESMLKVLWAESRLVKSLEQKYVQDKGDFKDSVSKSRSELWKDICDKAIYNSKESSREEKQQIKDRLMSKLQTREINNKEKLEKFVKCYLENGDTISILAMQNINDDKGIDYCLKGWRIYTQADVDFISKKSEESMEKTNIKQYNQVMGRLLSKGLNKDNNITELTSTMYEVLGHARSMELLDNKYGNITGSKLQHLFTGFDLSEVIFEPDGKQFKPVLNTEFINLIFGESFKIDDTPIKRYLDNKKSTEVTDEKSIELTDVMNKFSRVYNEWDIISEEYKKYEARNKLEVKKNIKAVSNILTIISSKQYVNLEARDEPLLRTNVLDYVGVNTQFVKNPNTAFARAVELSRGMENITAKKFPDIKVEGDGLILSTYNPQDRSILNAGYETECCFRANGNADNDGKNNSLLHYCTCTEYAGGINIKNRQGKVIELSPILRNGNILIAHSIETPDLNKEQIEEVNKLLKAYSEQVIEKSREKEGDNGIKAVVIGDLHPERLNKDYTKTLLGQKLQPYGIDGAYKGMYNNLDKNQYVLAAEKGFTEDDIRLGEVDYSYEYPVESRLDVSINKKDLEQLKKADEIKEQINLAIVERKKLLENKDNEGATEKLKEKKELQKQYLKAYNKEAIRAESGQQIIRHVVEAVNKKSQRDEGNTGKENYLRLMSGGEWYVAVDENKNVFCNFTEQGEQECEKVLKNTIDFIKDAQVHKTQPQTREGEAR